MWQDKATTYYAFIEHSAFLSGIGTGGELRAGLVGYRLIEHH